jgi:hypothetical protein
MWRESANRSWMMSWVTAGFGVFIVILEGLQQLDHPIRTEFPTIQL